MPRYVLSQEVAWRSAIVSESRIVANRIVSIGKDLIFAVINKVNRKYVGSLLFKVFSYHLKRHHFFTKASVKW